MPHPSFLAGESLPASKLRDLATRSTYTPSLLATTTNPTLGTGATQTGLYYITGALVLVQFDITFGTSGGAAGSGTYEVSLPSAAPIDVGIGNGATIGQVFLQDNSTSAFRVGIAVAQTATNRVRFRISDPTNTSVASSDPVVTNSVPWTWANSDAIRGGVTYIISE